MYTERTTDSYRGTRSGTSLCGLSRALILLSIAIFSISGARAQEVEGDLVYKFSVDGISGHDEAKPVQMALLLNGIVRSCVFIVECGCFEIASAETLGYGELDTLLREAGRSLNGPVEVSDGTLLLPPGQTER